MPGKNDFIYNSRPYQWLIRKEKEGVFNRIPSMDNTALDKKLNSVIEPMVNRYGRKKKRLEQAGQNQKQSRR